MKVQRDERFLVAYLPNNQKKAIMLFDYPIKDSTDFKRYVKGFEQKQKEE
jgi:23S rRNA A2030 N6-methylase RlmJ